MPVSNPIQVTAKNAAGDINVNYIPPGLDVTSPTVGQEWAALVIDSWGGTNPGTGNNYATVIKITGGNPSTNQLLYTVVDGVDADVVVGASLGLYSIFKGGWTLQKEPVLEAGAGWRENYVAAGPVFKRNDGKFIMLMVGLTNAGVQSIGAIESIDLINWSMYNDIDAPLIEAGDTGWAGVTGLWASGNPIWLEAEGKYIVPVSAGGGGTWDVYWIKFNSDLGDLEFSAGPITDGSAHPAGGSGIFAPSMVEYNGEYYLAVTTRQAATEDWEIWHLKAATPEGPYSTTGITVNPVVPKDKTDNETFYSSHIDANVQFVWGDGSLYMIAGGTSRWSESGVQGNRVFGLFKYDDATGLFVDDPRNPIWMFPHRARAELWGIEYNKYQDHLGGYFDI